MTKASCLITFRCENDARLKNLEFLLGLLEVTGLLEIVLVEQDDRPHLANRTSRQAYRYLFAHNSGPFNKSWGLNIAASQASTGLFIFIDADILLAQGALDDMLKRLASDADAVNPYEVFVDLGQAETEKLLGGDSQLSIQREEKQFDRKHAGQRTPYCGGVFGMTRELYERTGGMDERFEGWGAEDNAMSMRVAHFAHNAIELSGYPAYHLWHPVDTQYQRESNQVLRNYALLTAYSEYSESFYQAIAKTDALRNAELDKYTPTSRLAPESAAQPLISCLCVTRDRVDLLARAIECFQRQSWPNRELIVVCEDDDSDTARFLGQIEDYCIQVHIIPAQPKLSLGTLRNLSIDRANGEYICQWDDDDWYHPQRLARQLEYLQASGKGACVLARWLIYNTQQHKAWCSNTRLWEGSLLCKKALIQGATRYADTPTGEDSYLIEQLYVQDQVTVYDQPDLYVYMYSGRNTWDEAHFSNILSSSSPLVQQDTKRLARMIGIT